MKNKRISILCGIAVITLCGSTLASAMQTNFLFNLASGHWNKNNQRVADDYQIGFSLARPVDCASYFLFDFAPVKGRTVIRQEGGCRLLVVGSTDYHISTFWPNHAGSPPQVWFKMGATPQNTNYNTVAQITTGNNIAGLWNNQIGSNKKDNGYTWVMDGVHLGVSTDCWHYELTSGRGERIQKAVTAGELYVVFQAPRFHTDHDGQNYIWGSTSFDAGNWLRIVTE